MSLSVDQAHNSMRNMDKDVLYCMQGCIIATELPLLVGTAVWLG